MACFEYFSLNLRDYVHFIVIIKSALNKLIRKINRLFWVMLNSNDFEYEDWSCMQHYSPCAQSYQTATSTQFFYILSTETSTANCSQCSLIYITRAEQATRRSAIKQAIIWHDESSLLIWVLSEQRAVWKVTLTFRPFFPPCNKSQNTTHPHSCPRASS